MSRLVLDSTALVPAVLDPQGLRRKLLVLCAYGRVTAYPLIAREELGLRELSGGERQAGPEISDLRQRSERAAAWLAERLPSDAPSDVHLVGSIPIHKNFEQRLALHRFRNLPQLSREEANRRREELLRVTTVVIDPTNPFDPSGPPMSPRIHPRADPVVRTAFLGEAEFVVSDDPQIAPDPDFSVEYEDARGLRTCAIRFKPFLDRSFDFDLSAVDGALYGGVLGVLQSGVADA